MNLRSATCRSHGERFPRRLGRDTPMRPASLTYSAAAVGPRIASAGGVGPLARRAVSMIGSFRQTYEYRSAECGPTSQATSRAARAWATSDLLRS